MATRKESVSGKEKKIVSSPNHAAQHKKSPSPKTTASADQKHISAPSEKPEKHIPHYLKPTISSGLDSSKFHSKNQGLGDTSHKPNRVRRISLDRPPSSSLLNKSPSSPNLKDKTIKQSLSFAPKSTKPAERPKGSSRTAMTHSNHARHVPGKKPAATGTVTAKKRNNSRNAASGASSDNETQNSDISDTSKTENHEEDHQESGVNKDEAVQEHVGKDKELQAQNEPVEPVPEDRKDGELKPHCKVKEDQESPVEAHAEAVKGEIIVEEETSSANNHETEQLAAAEVENDENKEKEEEEKLADEPKEEAADLKEKTLDEKVGAKEPSQVPELNETEETEAEKKEAKSGVENEVKEIEADNKRAESDAPSAAAKPQAKKDAHAQAYNDVIEETASKLREKKNKVKALAGAFETVISLEKPNT